MRRLAVLLCVALTLAVAGTAPVAQGPSPAPITIVSPQGRRSLTVTTVNGGDYLSLDDVATALGLTLRDDRVTGTTTVTAGGRSAVLTPERNVVSAQGRLVSLAAPPLRQDGRLVVTPEFVTRVVGVLLDRRVDFRRAGRLFVIGDLRVPRVVVRGEFAASAAQVTFEIAPATEPTVTRTGSELVITFAADAVDAAVPTVPANPLLQSIRPGEGASLVLATGPRFQSHRTTVQPIDAGTTRLVIDLLSAGADTLTPGAPAAPAATPATPAAGSADPGPVPSLPPPPGGFRTIVIDPGHGGDANGTEGPGGTLEKTVTLQVSRRLKALLEGRLGLRVILTREDDRTLDQDERAAIANNNRADLFVSIHANAAVRPTVKGAEVYYLSVDRASLESRRAIQQPDALPQLGGGTRAIELILWETAQLRHLEQSATFAALVESALRGKVDMSPRPVQQAPFRVLVGANMPAVLVEIGYLSHPDEEKALTSAAHQDKVALAVFEAIAAFRGRIEKPAQ
ncbi:MAG: N-acetylmuramoyl-L-alanine amidase [Acidobacteria bacterium]|nr:N-acetylmuramoyl-L-alanine amidase [Acidobacteriota bacterium]